MPIGVLHPRQLLRSQLRYGTYSAGNYCTWTPKR